MNQRTSSLNRKPYLLFGVILIIVIWELLSLLIGENVFILPGPIESLKYAWYLLSNSYVYYCIFQSLLKMILGFIISFALSLIIGIISGSNEIIKYILEPLISLLRSIPTVSLVYLFLLLVGIKIAPILIVILVAFPILFENIVAGIENVPEHIEYAARVDGSSFFKTLLKIKLPIAKPYILAGVYSSIGLAFKIEIMAEVITGSSSNGLGSAIVAAQRSDPTNMLPVFAYSTIVIAISLIIDYLIKHSNNSYN